MPGAPSDGTKGCEANGDVCVIGADEAHDTSGTEGSGEEALEGVGEDDKVDESKPPHFLGNV